MLAWIMLPFYHHRMRKEMLYPPQLTNCLMANNEATIMHFIAFRQRKDYCHDTSKARCFVLIANRFIYVSKIFVFSGSQLNWASSHLPSAIHWIWPILPKMLLLSRGSFGAIIFVWISIQSLTSVFIFNQMGKSQIYILMIAL